MVCKHIGLYLLTFGCCFIWKHFYLLFIIICIFKLKKRNYICHAFLQLNIWFFLIQFILPGAGNCKPNEEIKTPPLKKKTSPKIQPQNSSGLSRKNPPWCYCLVKVVDTHKSVGLFIGDKTICPRPYISGQLKPLQKWFSNFDWILWVERERLCDVTGAWAPGLSPIYLVMKRAALSVRALLLVLFPGPLVYRRPVVVEGGVGQSLIVRNTNRSMPYIFVSVCTWCFWGIGPTWLGAGL